MISRFNKIHDDQSDFSGINQVVLSGKGLQLSIISESYTL